MSAAPLEFFPRGLATRVKVGLDAAVLDRLAHRRLNERGQALARVQDGLERGPSLGLDTDGREGSGLHDQRCSAFATHG